MLKTGSKWCLMLHDVALRQAEAFLSDDVPTVLKMKPELAELVPNFFSAIPQNAF